MQIDGRINSPVEERSNRNNDTPWSLPVATVTDTAALDASICNAQPEFPENLHLPGQFQALALHYRKSATPVEWERPSAVATAHRPGRILQNLNRAEEERMG